MNDDNETFVPDINDSSQESLDGANGQAVSPVAEQAQTPPPQDYLSRADFERWQTEQDAKWQARLKEVEQKAQAKADKARDTAIRKAEALEKDGYVNAFRKVGVEIDDAQVIAAKREVIDQSFWQSESTSAPSEQPTQPQTDVPPTLPPYVSRAELAQFLKENGLTENDVDLSAYENKPRYDDGLASRFQEDVLLAKAKQVEAKRVQQQNQQKAAQAAQVKANVGRVNPVPAGGAPSLGYDPVQELEKMDKMGLPDTLAERSKYKERYAKLMKEAYPD